MKRSLVLTIILALFCCVAVLAAAGSARAAGASAPQAVWTIALYANGDNDLMYTWPRFTLPALEAIPPNGAVNVVAMLDKPKKDGAWLYKVSGTSVETVKHFTDERDFGSGATFRWFLEQVHSRFPSDHLMVIGWDHGYAWHYFSKDSTSRDKILLPELKKAIVDAGVPIDILGFDACNMADVAVAWEAARAGKVGIMVASEESVPYEGFPWGMMLAPVAQDPSRAPVQVAADMVAGWKVFYDDLTWANSVQLAAVDVTRIGLAASDMQRWSARLAAGLPAYKKAYTAAAGRTWSPSYTRYEDFGGMCSRLSADASITDKTLKALTKTVLADLNAALIAQDTAPKTASATGLSIWWASHVTWTYYQDAFKVPPSFARPSPVGIDWWAFLDAYNRK